MALKAMALLTAWKAVPLLPRVARCSLGEVETAVLFLLRVVCTSVKSGPGGLTPLLAGLVSHIEPVD